MDVPKGEWVKGYPQQFFDDKGKRAEVSTVKCECGETKLLICWIDAPYSGGYCKVTCPTCGSSVILLDDFA